MPDTIVEIGIPEGSPIIWRLATEYVPTHDEGRWSRPVLGITNRGRATRIMYMSYWQRPVFFAREEFIEWWIDYPQENQYG